MGVDSVAIENVVVIGTGLMGSGIAQVSVEKGFNVTIVARNEQRLDEVTNKIRNGVLRGARKQFPGDEAAQNEFVDSIMQNLQGATDYADAGLETADLVIESVVEDMKVKHKLLEDIEAYLSPEAIVVTNTSSFQLAEVSAKFARPQRFAGLHFFNPVPAMKLVEVVRGDETLDAVNEALVAFVRGLGKSPVRCKDTHGFIVNHLLIPYLLDAMRMYERGDATKEDIDIAMKQGTGYPMGPFELSDYIGLDTLKFVVDGWHQTYPNDPRYDPPQILDNLAKQGKLGRKTSAGFYEYPVNRRS